MITFETKNKFKYFFIGNFFRIFYTKSGILNLFIIVFLTLSYTYFFSYIYSFFWILFLFVILPFIKFLSTRFFYKASETDYFFDKDFFGFKIAGGEIKFKSSNIEYIKVLSNCFVIKVLRQKLFFVGSYEDIFNTKEKLLNSNYKEFIKE